MAGERGVIKEFINCFETLPELWDVNRKDYFSREKRNDGYNKLLNIYKKCKNNATIADVKKKINTLRSSFRKELKKIRLSKISGAGTDELYIPSVWWFDEMKFLTNSESTFHEKSEYYEEEETENNQETEKDLSHTTRTAPKKSKFSKNEELLILACNYLSKDTDNDHFNNLARTWAGKLRRLSKTQCILAEKAINDVLFEAEMGTLQRNSVQINISSQPEFIVPSPLSFTK